jgi:plastocyanin
VLLCAAVSAAALGVLPSSVAHAEDQSVSASNADAFAPADVTVAKGDTVTWTWASDNGLKEHTVSATSANWDIDESLNGLNRSATFTFEAYGTYTYVCNVHGAAMSGRVRVPAPAKPTPKPTPKPTTASPKPTSSSPRPTATSSSTTVAPKPSQSSGTAGTPPLGGIATSAPPSPSRSGVPAPSIAPDPDESTPNTVTIGGPGLTPPPATGRGRGVWVMLACVAILGVGSAQLRTLLVLPADDPPPPSRG